MLRRWLHLVLLTGLVGCATTGVGPGVAPTHDQVGEASYVSRHLDGHATASGERYDGRRMTAAHRTLPFGTRVRVTNLANGTSVVVTINDRGPFRAGRVIDVSEHAADALGFRTQGVTRVRLEVLPG